jgi:RimJ/RimL family protein N-acetyltransferase
MHHLFPYSREQALTYIRENQRTDRRLVLAIVRKEDAAHIGNITLDSIDYISRSAALAIIVGDKSAWGKGYGREAARLICEHGFLTLNLRRISAGTFDDNAGFRRIAQYLGMVEEGRRRQAAFKLGRYVDIVEFGLLREEFLRRFHKENPAEAGREEESP